MVSLAARALRVAEERGLDLVEVNPKADPPVCKYLDNNNNADRARSGHLPGAQRGRAPSAPPPPGLGRGAGWRSWAR